MTWSRTWDVDNVPENAAPRAEPIGETAATEPSRAVTTPDVRESRLSASPILTQAPSFGAALTAAILADKPAPMTWAAFGKQLGLNPSTLGRVKSGHNLSLATMDEVARKRGWIITISRSV